MIKFCVVGLALVSGVVPMVHESSVSAAESFVQTFDGSPATPTSWNPDNWDVTVHSRDLATFDTLETMQAAHGPDCGAPPATHTINQYADAAFICKNHLMTAIKAEGYGAVYLTPDRQVDFSNGASISVDVSTLRTSLRDWWDIWVTPFDENLQAPLETIYPDLDGPPRDAIHIVMSNFNDGTNFKAFLYQDFQEIPIEGDWALTYENMFTPDAARRDTFQLDLSRGHLKFGMPADPNDGIPSSPITWIDAGIPDLGWSRGVVQFGHHSYNPEKDSGCGTVCKANTWHWDNVKISPAVPFTIVRATTRSVSGPNAGTMTLRTPAPANGFLRFMAVGKGMQVSFDGGKSWQAAQMQDQVRTAEEHAANYWMPIPAGATTVSFRGSKWFGGDWIVRDVSVFADNGQPSPNSQQPGAPIVPGNSSQYTPVAPSRLLDTRPGAATADGKFLGSGAAAPGSTIQLEVAGRAGAPANAAAVIMTVTAANATSAGYITVYPCDMPRPTASNINFAAGETIANTAISKIGADGTVCLYTGDGSTQVLADITGYLPAGSHFEAVPPARLLDTRPTASTIDGQSLGAGAAGPGTTTAVKVAGRAGVPGNASAVVLTVTAADAFSPGYLTVYPCDTPRPTASNANFSAGDTVANTVVSKVAADGSVCIYNGDGGTHLLADVTGYLPAGAEFTSVNPARLLDSRPGASTADGLLVGIGAVQPGSTTEVQVNARAGVPSTAAAAVLTITAANATSPGYFTVYPCGTPRPTASNVNFAAGGTVANTVISKVGTDGRVCIYTGDGSTHLLVDVAGYFPATAGFSGVGFSASGNALVLGGDTVAYCELESITV